MNKVRTIGVTTAVAAALLAPAVAASPAFASGGSGGSGGGGSAVKASGACSATGTWKLKAKPDDGRLEIEFEVDTNKAGQVFAVKVTDNATVVFQGSRTTQGPSGSFSLERRTPDRAGADTVTAVATRGANTCTGTVTVR